MLKMVIELDEKKIKREKKYDVERIYSFLDGMFKKRGINVGSKGEYIYLGKDENEGLFQFMVLAGVLKTEEWFTRYVVNWLWYEESDEAEDLIDTFKITTGQIE